MGIYIRGTEMPKEGTVFVIDSAGQVWSNEWPTRGYIRLDGVTAVSAPPHGRLIEDEAVREQIDEWLDSVGYVVIGRGLSYYGELLGCIEDAPTIIEAEGKGYILAPQEEYDGLKRKYVVFKSDTGECVENCFVLRPDKDKAAIAALLAYADATDNQVLAKDIRAWISTIQAEEVDDEN